MYPGDQAPAYFTSLGLALEEPLARTPDRAGLTGPDAPVFVQSFEPTGLHRRDPGRRTARALHQGRPAGLVRGG